MRSSSLSIVFWIILILLIGGCSIGFNVSMGTHGFGPERTFNATVISKHVDISGSGDSRKSHYMVSTSEGTFEVQNGWILGMFNADELYGKLKEGNRYRITTKGNKVVNFWSQQYPYIIRVE